MTRLAALHLCFDLGTIWIANPICLDWGDMSFELVQSLNGFAGRTTAKIHVNGLSLAEHLSK